MNGTFDTGFAPAGDGGISSIALRADGSMFIGGVFTTMGGYGFNGLAHLNTDGNTDLTFNPGSGVNSYPTALAVQQDGKVLLGGGFSGFNGPARKFLARRFRTDHSMLPMMPGSHPGSGPVRSPYNLMAKRS
ncbi:MAG: delta-60 repeat domain-containing protein [Flavobacteriales bacterium]|nr:delta-60 repeat domain-containing protein [Flavobacteriales bacterium]